MTNNTPLEIDDQMTLVEWMERKGLKFTAIPNSTWTKSANQKRKNYLSGLRRGFPDLVIIVPSEASKTGKTELIFIEMKRKKGGVVSAEQCLWLDALDDAGQKAFVATGLDEAIEILSKYVK